MTRHCILELGAGPAGEPCAQLGSTPDFAAANMLELLTYKAAIIALNREPPLPLGFALVANAHDFGTYRKVEASIDNDEDDGSHASYLETLEAGIAF